MIVNLWLEYAKRKSGLILGKWWLKWIVRVRATKCPELFILTCSLYIEMLTFYISTGGAGSILLIRRNSLLLRETMSRNKHNTRLVSAGGPRREGRAASVPLSGRPWRRAPDAGHARSRRLLLPGAQLEGSEWGVRLSPSDPQNALKCIWSAQVSFDAWLR